METTVHSCEHTVRKGLYTTSFNYSARVCFFQYIFIVILLITTDFVIDPDVYTSAKR